jgi:aryl-alcohol dehydrogenase-like predicted oxidoreductase
MNKRALGRSGIEVTPIGLGCMGMSEFYGPIDDEQSVRTMHRAVDLGVDLFDTSDMYGIGHNESLIGRFLRETQSLVRVGTKFGFIREKGMPKVNVSGSPAHVRAACEASLRRLGREVIDLYYYHRLDRDVPIEETVGAMGELVKDGLVRAIGLSEVSADTIARAHAVHPIAAVQSEYSLWTRDPEDTVIPTCKRLGISFVAYSPLGRGFLAGAIRTPRALAPGDLRLTFPRFQEESLARNATLVEVLQRIARSHDATPARVALAWVLSRGDDIVAIAGTRRPAYVEDNVSASRLALDADDLATLDRVFARDCAAGERYPALQMAFIDH